MKYIIQTTCVLAVLFAIAACAQTNSPAPRTRVELLTPVLSLGLVEAVKIAQSRLQDEKVDTSKHYLDNIRLLHSSSWMEGKHWIVTWKLNVHADGGEILVFVGMDKKTRVHHGI